MKLEFRGVTKAYHLQHALDCVTFSASEADIVGIVGPNGAGKTTLIRLAARLTNPSEGNIYLNDKPLKKAHEKRIGLISPFAYLYSDLTVAENLELYSGLYNAAPGLWRQYAEYFDLTEMLNKQIAELSHGQKRRASLARVMLGEPDILLLDEPFLGLDTEATGELKKLIIRLNGEGKTILLATHHFEIAQNIINKLMVLNRGKMIYFDKFEKERASLNNLYIEILK